MADLKLVIDSSDVGQALSSVGRLEGQIKKLTSRFSSGSSDQATYAKGLLQIKREYEKLGLSSQKATAEVQKYAKAQRASADQSAWFSAQRRKMSMMKESQRIAERAATEEARALKEVELATARVAAEKDRLRAKYNPLYAASQLYERSLQEIDRALESGAISAARHRIEMDRLEAEYKQFASGAEIAANANNRFAQSAALSSRRMNTNAVLTQQAGYQIGDFLVQVQSGTNWMVAFGQQATQVAGTLTLLGGKMVLIGSALGIAIPLVTALGAVFLRTRKQAEETEKVIDRLASTARSAFLEVQAFTSGFVDVDAMLAQRELNQLSIERLEVLREIYSLEQLGAPTGPNERQLANLDEQIRNLERQLELREQAIAAETRLAEARDMANEAARRYISRGEVLQDLEDQYQIQLLINNFGEDSLEVERLRAAQARETFSAEAQRLSVSENQYNLLMANYDLLQRQTEEFRNSRDEAERVSDAISLVLAQDFTSFNSQVRLLAELLGTSADEALRLLNNLPMGVTLGEGLTAQGITGGEALFGGMEGDIPAGRGGSSGGGGGSEVQTIQQIIAARQEQIAMEMRLLGMSEEQRRIQEIINELENAYQGELDETGRAAIATAAQAIAADEERLESAQRLIEQQQQLADSIAQSFGDAFTSVVDGTKTAEEAFRDMARNIIAELFDVLVVQQMVANISGVLGGSKGGGLGGILGGLFGGGATKRASGGTMNSNMPYLVGERGPEIVMPGRGSTVMNNDLSSKAMGGTQNVNVRVFVDDNGNFDARVESISAQTVQAAAPAIVKQSVGSMMDTRRRGGAAKGVFG